jgi:hypothetical protein
MLPLLIGILFAGMANGPRHAPPAGAGCVGVGSAGEAVPFPGVVGRS